MAKTREDCSDSCERDFLVQASLDPAAFAWLASRGQWQLAPHLDLLAERLLDVAQGKLKRLLIQMPPRHGKSEFASAHFPAWYLGTFPERRVILASYEHDFAASWGAKARDRFAQFGPVLWQLWVKRNKQASDDWQIAGHAGGMVCAGVGGPIMGRGADLLIIDDPVKSAEEADSETYRNRAWDWYRATAYTRLEPGGAILLIQTRWHEDDLAGRVLAEAAKTGERWEVIKLPALAEDNDVLGRAEGEPLWPERFPAQALAEIRESIGPYWWQALYQQRPSPPEGALFLREWWCWDERPPACHEQMISVDCAFKKADDSSYVVVQVWGRANGVVHLLDQDRRRADFAETVDMIQAMAARWPKAHRKLIEDAANGPAVISHLQRRLPGMMPVKPEGGKYSRAQAVQWLAREGRIFLPRGAAWVDGFVSECATFPRGQHDDQIDAMSQALRWWYPLRPVERVAAPESEFDRRLRQIMRRQNGSFLRPAHGTTG